MKSNKIIIFILTVIFVAVTVCAFFAVFTVKQVKIDFSSAYKTEDAERLTEQLSKYEGVNLLFFKENSIREDVEKYPYLELTGVEKKYPNIISVTVRERQEVYLFSYNDSTYVATADGFVLSDDSSSDGHLIELVFEGDIFVRDAEPGAVMSSSDDDILGCAFELVRNVRLTDCIKKMTISKNIEQTDVVFDTYTDVKIRIPKIDTEGVNKVVKAFEFYDNEKSDYIKTSNEIRVDLLDDGTLRVAWVSDVNS